ncbi:MAG: anthranilate synthase component I family protein [Pseudomonadota bacterium]
MNIPSVVKVNLALIGEILMVSMAFPLKREISYQNPLAIFAGFAPADGAVFLDSAQLREGSRFSFIAVSPFMQLRSKNGLVELDGRRRIDDPFQVLAEKIKQFPLPQLAGLPPFQGGVAGYFGYGLYQHLEKLAISNHDDMQFPDAVLGFYDLVIAFDLIACRAWIFSSGYPEQGADRASRAEQRLQWCLAQIPQAPIPLPRAGEFKIASTVVSNFTATTYQIAVKKVIDYILAGDIFEANIAQRFSAKLGKDCSPFDLYLRLRELNPAPFAAYLNFNDVVIASASPERFLKLYQRQVEARPIKGTRARSSDAKLDTQLAVELQTSVKDRAENIMIVDLLRNDLSRVCKDFTVKVTKLCALESYATVHHLVSVVVGELVASATALDLLRATFPGGSITGAPKIRAMEIINEIEPTARGPYCGSIGYLGFDGSMDCAITIRTFAIKNGIVTFQAGGAVVADSVPVLEYEETLAKAQVLWQALTGMVHDFAD